MKNDTSPFAEKSWQEQQEQWRVWRSMQLEYRPAEEETKMPKAETIHKEQMPVRPVPSRHRELDRVLSRHKAAVNRAGAFRQTLPGEERF